mgnify:CR=1 FL=1
MRIIERDYCDICDAHTMCVQRTMVFYRGTRTTTTELCICTECLGEVWMDFVDGVDELVQQTRRAREQREQLEAAYAQEQEAAQ